MKWSIIEPFLATERAQVGTSPDFESGFRAFCKEHFNEWLDLRAPVDSVTTVDDLALQQILLMLIALKFDKPSARTMIDGCLSARRMAYADLYPIDVNSLYDRAVKNYRSFIEENEDGYTQVTETTDVSDRHLQMDLF